MSWGEIYNTSWWGIALDTARTVKARPDFFGSQLNLLTSEQPNLVTNGTFDTDSDWLLNTGWSINEGRLLSVNSAQYVSSNQNLAGVTLGKTYKTTINVNSIVGDYIVKFGSSGSIYPLSLGLNTFYEVWDGTSKSLAIYNNTSSTGNITIDNISVQVVRAELDQIEAKKCLADWIHTTALKDLNN